MCAVLQPLVLTWGLYPAFLSRECGILIPGVVMCWGKLGACGAKSLCPEVLCCWWLQNWDGKWKWELQWCGFSCWRDS